MSSAMYPEETIEFENDEPIVLDYKSAVSYKDTDDYDRARMAVGFVWHMVVIHHRAKYPKKAILDAIFRAVGDEEFFPMVYKEGPKSDRFLVRQYQPALDKLFAKNLNLSITNGNILKLEVILNVGKFKFGQISPSKRIEKALERLFNNLEDGGILNLSDFAKNPEFSDIVINLRNSTVLDVICRSVSRNEKQFRRVNGLKLRKNNIVTLQPLEVHFKNCEFDVLDLRSNLLHSASSICKELKNIKIQELFLDENPVTEGEDYPLNMKNLFVNFSKLDGRTIEQLRTMPKADKDLKSKLIDPRKPHRLKKFENSDDWNLITISNKKNYTKQQILDAFFDAFPPELSEIYPCNYQEDGEEHSFYVRECFEQLKYLVKDCKLQIPAPDSDDEKLYLQLKMNVKSFDSDPLEPVKAISKAIVQGFIPKERILNLEDFSSSTDLENVELDMRSPKVLNRVLTQAGNRLARNIFELRLGHNRIRSCNFAKPFIQMTRLCVLDLSYNNLKDFCDFLELQRLPIKALSLEGNPLCDLYTYAPEYIRNAKSMFPDLTKLDNVALSTIDLLVPKKNYLCDVKGYDLVQQFVTHYFPVFDSENRLNLKEMYHPKAIFSMSCNYSMANLSAHKTKRIAKYTNLSTNILKMPDFSRAMASLHCGTDEICQALAGIPNTEHDIFGFNTDTTIINDKMVVITIGGVFRDVAVTGTDADLILSFSRTFVLHPIAKATGLLKGATEYQIVNDFFSVANPSDAQINNSFKFYRNPLPKSDPKLSATDKEGRLIMFQQVTTLKTIWCKRLLEEGEWDFKRSLEIFVEEGQKNKIPQAAFM